MVICHTFSAENFYCPDERVGGCVGGLLVIQRVFQFFLFSTTVKTAEIREKKVENCWDEQLKPYYTRVECKSVSVSQQYFFLGDFKNLLSKLSHFNENSFEYTV